MQKMAEERERERERERGEEKPWTKSPEICP
jgi:hypothetical protein